MLNNSRVSANPLNSILTIKAGIGKIAGLFKAWAPVYLFAFAV
jgi:hypothetical protein